MGNLRILGITCLSVLLTGSSVAGRSWADDDDRRSNANALVAGTVSCSDLGSSAQLTLSTGTGAPVGPGFGGLGGGVLGGIPVGAPLQITLESSGLACGDALESIAATASAQRGCVVSAVGSGSLFPGSILTFVCSGSASSVLGSVAAISEAVVGAS